jgi:hypothetical protein
MWRPAWLRHLEWRNTDPHPWVALPNGLMLTSLGAAFLIDDVFKLQWKFTWQVMWPLAELTDVKVAGFMTLVGVLLLADSVRAWRKTVMRIIVWQAAWFIEWWIVWHMVAAFMAFTEARPWASLVLSASAAIGLTTMLWFGPVLVGADDANRSVGRHPLPRRIDRDRVAHKCDSDLQENRRPDRSIGN